MEVRAVVKYRGALAHYGVLQENEGIYQAHLIRYDGRPDHAPAAKITLVKGLNHWSGSSDREELVDEIGAIIDRKLQNPDHIEGGHGHAGSSSKKETYVQRAHGK